MATVIPNNATLQTPPSNVQHQHQQSPSTVPVPSALMPATHYPIIIPQQQPQRSHVDINTLYTLSIIQIFIGLFTAALGIGSTIKFDSTFWLTESSAGIWTGLIILASGVLGLVTVHKQKFSSLSGVNLLFNIFCTVLSFVIGVCFAVGIGYYNNCERLRRRHFINRKTFIRSRRNCRRNEEAGKAIYSLLLVLMVAEFFVSLMTAIYFCHASHCCNRTSQQPQGVVYQPNFLPQLAQLQQLQIHGLPPPPYTNQGLPTYNTPVLISSPQLSDSTHHTNANNSSRVVQVSHPPALPAPPAPSAPSAPVAAESA